MTAKITKQNVIEVSKEIKDRILKISESHIYSVDSDLYYEGQIPIVAYLLVKGEVSLNKKRRKDVPIRPGSLFGLKELMLNDKSTYGAQIKAKSEVCFLDKSLIKEIIDFENDEDLKTIFENLLLENAG
jgi:CRP-like cAMP-binding protein